MSLEPLDALRHRANQHKSWQDVLADTGEIFAVFDENTQDSGNISFGWIFQEQRYFAKTAGYQDAGGSINTFARRCHWLRQAASLAQTCSHPLLPAFHGTIDEVIACPLLLYGWRSGELVRVGAEQRDNPDASYQRFLHLPWQHRIAAMDKLLQLHAQLDTLGYVIVDLYDGSLLYDFTSHQLTLIDLDMYHLGPITNDLGRWWGSSRFMAPEEFEQDALIDACTSVFTLGRFLQTFLLDNVPDALKHSDREIVSHLETLVAAACAQARTDRFVSPTELFNAWQAIHIAMVRTV